MASYTVKKGDTLSAIAKKYGTTYQQIAKDNGISNPNKIQVGQTLNIGGSTKKSTGENNTSNATTTNNSKTSTITEQEAFDKGFNNTFDESKHKDVMEYKDKTQSSLDRVENLTNKENIINPETIDKANQQFQVSDAYTQAMQFTQTQLEQLLSGKTSYTDQIKELMGQIQNREDFEYDVDKDQLFQQALSSAMRSGQSAMQDTIGQASALTGGYGSTYATSAGNQAYNSFIEDAYNNLPEYYQMALEAYQMEGEEMYRQLDMLNTADANEYQRIYNSWDASFRNAQDIWNKDFSTWDAEVNQAFNSANLQLSEHGQLVDDAYKAYTMNYDMYQTLYSQAWNNWDSQVKQAQGAYDALQTERWNQKEFDEQVRQFDKTYEQTERWNQKDLDYKYENLALDREKFNYSKGDLNNDGAISDEEKALLNGTNGVSLTDDEIEQLKTAYANAGGGDAGDKAVDAKLSLWNKQGVDNAALDTVLKGTDVPVWKQTWTISKDTGNGSFFLWGNEEDGNDVFTNGTTTMTYDELKGALKDSDLTEYEKEQFLKKLQKQSTK